jgi:DNA-binding response OmpR family regulator
MHKILVIDDDESICEMLSMYLTEEGYDVITANTGGQGLKKFLEGNIDLVILDIYLPDISGFTVLKNLKKEDENVKVIMVTAFHDIAFSKKAITEGAFMYVRKPIDIKELELAIKNALN